MNKQEFDSNVIEWATERGSLPNGSTVGAQLGKTLEEIGELWQAIAVGDCDEILDAFGDIDVTLVIAGELCVSKSSESPTGVETFGSLLAHICYTRVTCHDYGIYGARQSLAGIAERYGVDMSQARAHAWGRMSHEH